MRIATRSSPLPVAGQPRSPDASLARWHPPAPADRHEHPGAWSELGQLADL